MIYSGGKNNFEEVAAIAERCRFFKPDCEEEWVTDEDKSCYNCRYRRWTKDSFACLKGSEL